MISYFCTSVVYSYYLKAKQEKKDNHPSVQFSAILPAENLSLLSKNNQPPPVNDVSGLPIKNHPFVNIPQANIASAPTENQFIYNHNLKSN